MIKIKSLLTILLVLLVFNEATLQSQVETVTLYISDDDSKSRQESDSASWKTSRNLVSDHEYVGEMRNGLPNGVGSYSYPGGLKYEGSFKDGRFSGQGISTLPDGLKYEGSFKDGKEHGEGTLTLPSGAKYVGSFLSLIHI